MANSRRDGSLKPERMADAQIARGQGGETHQAAGRDVDVLTTQHGIPVGDNQNSLKAEARGPTLLEDFYLREKLFHFDHERIPERVVHARGFGAHGILRTISYFRIANSPPASAYSRTP
jgi:catalase